MDKIRDIFSYFIAAMTMFSFLGAVYQAFQKEVGSALTLGTLFLVGALIVFLPNVEFIKTLGVEARLRQTVTEAVATLESLKRLSQISARASYLTIAWGNRFGTPPVREKQAVLDQIDAQLTELKISSEDRVIIQKPFVEMMKLDFFFLYSGVIDKYAGLINQKLVDDAHSSQNAAAVMRHSELITAWSDRAHRTEAAADLKRLSLEEKLNDYTPIRGEWLGDRDLDVIDKFKREIVRLNAECEKKGGYTKEAEEYYDRYANDSVAIKAEQLRTEALR
jgi:hypothetical protein